MAVAAWVEVVVSLEVSSKGSGVWGVAEKVNYRHWEKQHAITLGVSSLKASVTAYVFSEMVKAEGEEGEAFKVSGRISVVDD